MKYCVNCKAIREHKRIILCEDCCRIGGICSIISGIILGILIKMFS